MKLLILISLLCSSLELPMQLRRGEPSPVPYTKVDSDLQEKALYILESKCNVCHVKRNPGKVFTAGNMDSYASKIRKQVFIKKRMPKGNKIILSPSERDALNTWVKKTLNLK